MPLSLSLFSFSPYPLLFPSLLFPLSLILSSFSNYLFRFSLLLRFNSRSFGFSHGTSIPPPLFLFPSTSIFPQSFLHLLCISNFPFLPLYIFTPSFSSLPSILRFPLLSPSLNSHLLHALHFTSPPHLSLHLSSLFFLIILPCPSLHSFSTHDATSSPLPRYTCALYLSSSPFLHLSSLPCPPSHLPPRPLAPAPPYLQA